MELRYWDSGCWCAQLARETGRYERTRSVLKAAAEGELKIVTSALALIPNEVESSRKQLKSRNGQCYHLPSSNLGRG